MIEKYLEADVNNSYILAEQIKDLLVSEGVIPKSKSCIKESDIHESPHGWNIIKQTADNLPEWPIYATVREEEGGYKLSFFDNVKPETADKIYRDLVASAEL